MRTGSPEAPLRKLESESQKALALMQEQRESFGVSGIHSPSAVL